MKKGNSPNKEHQRDFEEAYFYLIGQASLVFGVDSLPSL